MGYATSVQDRPDIGEGVDDAAGLRPSGGYFAAVDGLRGAAILCVLLYHTSMFSRGLFGVDVFFVLSGFLITLLLREADKTGRVGIGGFYRRRFKRLFPGLVITLAGTEALTYLLGSLQEARRISGQAVAALFQVANWSQSVREEAGWDQFGQINPVAHMWSVSITGQFYLVWPVLLGLLCWVFRRSIVALTVSAWAAFTAAAAVAWTMFDGTNSESPYLRIEVRAVGFLAGAAAACIVHLLHRRRARRPSHRRHGVRRSTGSAAALVTVLGIGGLAVLLAASALIASYNEPWLYRGGLALVAAAAAVLTATLCYDRGPLFRLFSWPPLVDIGKMSYPMYLLHLPIYWLLQEAKPLITPYALLVVGGGLTWFVSMILHYGITERLRVRPWRVSRALPTLALSCAAIAASPYLLPGAIENRMNTASKPVVLTLGDSFANDLAAALADHGADRFAVVDGGVPDCGIMSSEKVRDRTGLEVAVPASCRNWENSWKITIRETGPEAIVVHLGWDAALQQVAGAWLSPCDAAYRKRYRTQLDRAARVWAAEAPDVPVLLMNERTATGATDAAASRCYNAIVHAFAAAKPRLELLNLDVHLCPGGKCWEENPHAEPLHVDGVHLTRQGMDDIAPWLEKAIAAQRAATPRPSAMPLP